MPRSAPRAAAVACAILVAALLDVAVSDFTRTQNRVPPLPPVCASTSGPCIDERNAQVNDRLRRALRLQADYRRRAWIYAGLGAAAVALTVLVSLLAGPGPAARRSLFTNLGAAGVALGILVTALLWLSGTRTVDPPAAPAYFLPLSMIAVAGVGGSVVRLGGAAPVTAPTPRRALVGRLALGGLALTAATILLAWLVAAQQPSCGGSFDEPGAPGWTDAVEWLALVTALGAVLLGLVALTARRWFVALVCVVVNPAPLLLMVASTCAFY
jgi:hypothetical protein